MTTEERLDDTMTPEERLELLARRAGTAYRREAPEDGLTRLTDRRRRRQVTRAAAAVAVTGALAGVVMLVGGSEDPEPSTVVADTVVRVTVTVPVTAVTAPAAPGSTAGRVVSADDQWGLEYTGGVLAGATGEPLRIGFVSDGDWMYEAGLLGGVTYVNTKLGGAGGRPIEIVECETIPGDASSVAACEQQFVEDGDLLAVTAGGGISPVESLIPNVNRVAPVVLPFLGGSFLVSPTPGLAGPFEIGPNEWGVTQAMVQATKLFDSPPQRVTLLAVFAGDLAGRLEAVIPEIDIVPVELPVTGDFSAAAIADALRSVPEAVETDALVVLGGPRCGDLREALTSMGVDPPAVVLDSCVLGFATPYDLSEPGAATAPTNWIMMTSAYDPTDPMALGYRLGVYQQGRFMPPAGSARIDGGGFAIPMVIARLVNEMGADDADPESLRAALSEFRGPVPLQYGPLECGELAPLGQPIPMACNQYMGAFKVVDGEWVAIANGTNGKLIGLNGMVEVPAN